MNYTQNYQLNQWEESDRVLMEDFNSLTRKIDGAMAGLAAKESWNQLSFYYAPAAALSLSTSVPTAQIIQQQMLLIRVSIPSGAAYLTLNGGGKRFQLSGSAMSWELNGVAVITSEAPGWMLIPVGKTGEGKIRGISMGMEIYYAACDIAPSALSSLTLTSTSSDVKLPFGTTIQVWGCR